MVFFAFWAFNEIIQSITRYNFFLDKTEHADHPNSVLVNAIRFFELSAQVSSSLKLALDNDCKCTDWDEKGVSYVD